MGKKYEVHSDNFREKVIAAIFYGYRTVKNPVSITVHPELMAKIRLDFKDKILAPKKFGDEETFFGLPVVEDDSKGRDYIAVR